LNELKDRGKINIILSNTSKRAAYVHKLLDSLGFPKVEAILTSGELAYDYIKKNFNGKKCCWFTWDNYQSDDFFADLNVRFVRPEDADFLLFHGSQRLVYSSQESMEIDLFKTGKIDGHLLSILSIAKDRNIPAICANMDLMAIQATGQAHMPGS